MPEVNTAVWHDQSHRHYESHLSDMIKRKLMHDHKYHKSSVCVTFCNQLSLKQTSYREQPWKSVFHHLPLSDIVISGLFPWCTACEMQTDRCHHYLKRLNAALQHVFWVQNEKAASVIFDSWRNKTFVFQWGMGNGWKPPFEDWWMTRQVNQHTPKISQVKEVTTILRWQMSTFL